MCGVTLRATHWGAVGTGPCASVWVCAGCTRSRVIGSCDVRTTLVDLSYLSAAWWCWELNLEALAPLTSESVAEAALLSPGCSV